MKHEESHLQIACVRWFRYQYPGIAPLFWKNANEGKRSKALGGISKAEGLQSGVPDLFLAKPSRGWHGLFVELKIGKNKLTDNQRQMIEILTANAYKCEVVRSIDEFMNVIWEYLKYK